MNKNRRQSLLTRQTGTAKIFDACYATDEATYYTKTGGNFANNTSQQSLSSHVSSNEEVSISSDEDTSPDVTNAVPNVIFTPNTPNLHQKVNGNLHSYCLFIICEKMSV